MCTISETDLLFSKAQNLLHHAEQHGRTVFNHTLASPRHEIVGTHQDAAVFVDFTTMIPVIIDGFILQTKADRKYHDLHAQDFLNFGSSPSPLVSSMASKES